MKSLVTKLILAAVLFWVAATPALACTACAGASDSPLAQGMNWGIMTLLGVITCVLGGIVMFFVHVGRQSAKLTTGESNSIQTPTDKSE